VIEADTMFVCANCGSPSVEVSALVGGGGSCKACGWSGSREELVSIPVRRDGLADGDQVFVAMYNNFRKIFSASALPLTRFLVKWGFVSAVQRGMKVEIEDPKLVVRYINALFQGALRSVLETREALEKERVNGG